MKKVLFLLLNKYLFTIIISFIFIISCNKKEEPIIYELFGQQIDTLIIGEPFTPTFFITLPPATVSFYLEGPLKDFKGIAGQFYSDNISDSLYIRDDMLFIHKISTFEKNEYNKKYWKIPSFTWIPSAPLVEGNRMYCFIVQGIWEKEGIPRITIRNYVYMKEN